MTKAQQETMVGEGLAVGVLSLGVVAVTSNRLAVSSAFARAWRSWAHSGRIPSVRVDLAREDIFRILGASSGRRGPITADWSTGGEYVPNLLPDWSLEEAGDHIGEAAGVPHAAWVNLARAFVADLGEDAVRRD